MLEDEGEGEDNDEDEEKAFSLAGVTPSRGCHQVFRPLTACLPSVNSFPL